MDSLGPGLVLALTIAGLFIVVLWVLLPFAIFGTKDLLRELIHETRQARQALERLTVHK